MTFSSPSLSPSALYFATYLTIVLPSPKVNNERYPTTEFARLYNPYSDCPKIRNITGV